MDTTFRAGSPGSPNLHINFNRDPNSIQVQEGKEIIKLWRISSQDQRLIES